MKRISASITIITVLILMTLVLTGKGGDYIPGIITFGIMIMLVMEYLYFESGTMGAKEIALIATLSAFSGVSRVVFAALPNIKPTTFLVALSGYVFGPFEGFLIGATSAFISNIFLGQGPWSPWQMFAWGIVGTISGFIGKKEKPVSTETFSILCFGYGFLFDWIMNLWHVLGFVRPITIETVFLAYVSGLTFDVIHAASSFVFSIVFYEKFKNVLCRFKRRMEITYMISKP